MLAEHQQLESRGAVHRQGALHFSGFRGVVQEDKEEAGTSYSTAPQFLDYVRHRKLVTFKRLEDPKVGPLSTVQCRSWSGAYSALEAKRTPSLDLQEAGFELELSLQNTYEHVEAAVARKLGLQDQRMLRFTAHNTYTQVGAPPRLTPAYLQCQGGSSRA